MYRLPSMQFSSEKPKAADPVNIPDFTEVLRLTLENPQLGEDLLTGHLKRKFAESIKGTDFKRINSDDEEANIFLLKNRMSIRIANYSVAIDRFIKGDPAIECIAEDLGWAVEGLVGLILHTTKGRPLSLIDGLIIKVKLIAEGIVTVTLKHRYIVGEDD